MALTNRDLQLIKQQSNQQFEQNQDVKRGQIVNVNGSHIGTLPNTVWVQPLDDNASPMQVFNPGTIQNLQTGVTVYYRQSPKPPAPWELINFDLGLYAPAANQYEDLWQLNVAPHAPLHELKAGYPGPDPLNVHPHAVVDLSVRPTNPASMKVRIYGGWYAKSDGNYAFLSGPFNSADLTASIPGSTGLSKIIAFVLNRSTGVVSTVAGSNYVEGTTPSYPTVTTNYILLSAVRLTNGMTAIENRNFDREMRAIVGNTGAGFNVSEVYQLWESDGGAVVIESDADGNITFNEGGEDRDIRIESNTRTHAFFLRGSDGAIGINESSPEATVHINDDGAVLFLEGSTSVRFDMIDQSSTSGQRRFAFSVNSEQLIISQRTDAGGFTQTFWACHAGNQEFFIAPEIDVGLGRNTGSIVAQVDIDQSDTNGQQPVLKLDQADLSEEFIEFAATVGAGNPIDTAAIGTYYGKIRVSVTGVGFKYMALYNS